MTVKTVDLYAYFGVEKPQGAAGTLQCCLHAQSSYYPNRTHPAILAVAGGGYVGVCEREGEPVGAAFFGQGYQLFTLTYTCKPAHYPTQLIEGAMAIAYIRKNAEQLQVDPQAIAAVGFSAGGHFVGMLATLTDEPEVKAALGADAALAKPDAVILGYPVITNGEYAHRESLQNISGGNADLAEKLSLETRVTSKSAPAFIWGTADDGLVPSENAMLMALAYKRAGVPFEFHLYEHGPHGLALATRHTAAYQGIIPEAGYDAYIDPVVATWYPMALTWLERHGFMVKD